MCVAKETDALEHHIDLYKKLDGPPCPSTNYTYACTEKSMLLEKYQNKSVIGEPGNIISRYIYFHRIVNGFVNL